MVAATPGEYLMGPAILGWGMSGTPPPVCGILPLCIGSCQNNDTII
jgi:hypothetical protein